MGWKHRPRGPSIQSGQEVADVGSYPGGWKTSSWGPAPQTPADPLAREGGNPTWACWLWAIARPAGTAAHTLQTGQGRLQPARGTGQRRWDAGYTRNTVCGSGAPGALGSILPPISWRFFNIFLFIYFWLHWVFIAVRGLSLVMASGSYSLVAMLWLLIVVTSLIAEPRL